MLCIGDVMMRVWLLVITELCSTNFELLKELAHKDVEAFWMRSMNEANAFKKLLAGKCPQSMEVGRQPFVGSNAM